MDEREKDMRARYGQNWRDEQEEKVREGEGG
eukprot:CAMPEP_0113909186 /NCGR_PEP_ID=MMETSP0780_2-20120614/26669_1 /TAXON_ID=652834 /ORGANISM="Palpitomonas bilix" /LENGTH=30 /DNA_ID=CAMNT_0000904881 /DNA_START=87 /DNA_END=176 /DNA_ORIENTATION=+ /assembly_acc=CAM_ASM_000599